jgi:hypothetical protein
MGFLEVPNKYSFIFSIKIIKMKNKILSSFAALSIAAIAVFNLGLVSKNSDLSDVSMANVEALADGETSVSASCTGWLGWCSLDCKTCGAKLNALGSGYVHNCTSN